jgi:hypothetical protein
LAGQVATLAHYTTDQGNDEGDDLDEGDTAFAPHHPSPPRWRNTKHKHKFACALARCPHHPDQAPLPQPPPTGSVVEYQALWCGLLSVVLKGALVIQHS